MKNDIVEVINHKGYRIEIVPMDCTDYEGNETVGPCRCCPKECIVIHQMLGDYHE